MAAKTGIIVVALTIIGLVCPSNGNAFLAKGNETNRFAFMNASSVKQLLLDEVYGFMGKGQFDVDLPQIQKELEPMWLALPKNQQGNLDSSQVQYAIHRFFVQRHGWHIDGLDRIGAASAQDTPAGILRERIPAYLMEIFEEAFGTTGLQLHELSIFAATLEHIIHDEVTDRLKDVYQAVGKPISAHLSEAELDLSVDTYLMSVVLGEQRLKAAGSLTSKFDKLTKAYPGWRDTQMFLRDVQRTVTHLDEGRKNPFIADPGYKFGEVERIVEQVSRRFGSFQDTECRQLKDTLLEAEDRDTGRVLLSDFYKKGIEANVLFKETPDYLRQQGALDESKPGEPRVIVPNFILSPGNCLADTGFYSICCINECEGLLAHIERTIADYEATPEKLVEVVQNLPSSSVEAPRTLSPRLVSQIELVAMRHGGKVPLHSRSLAQWLHVAFPHECPYPLAASVRSELTTAELRAQQVSSKLDSDARMEYIKTVQPQESEDVQQDEMAAEKELLDSWSHEEEMLYAPVNKPSALLRMFASCGQTVIVLGVFACGAASLADAVRRGRGMETSLQGRKEKTHLV